MSLPVWEGCHASRSLTAAFMTLAPRHPIPTGALCPVLHLALGPKTKASLRSCLPGVRRLFGQDILPCGDRGLVKEVPIDPVTFPIDLVWSGPQRPQHGLRQGQS